jgi:hypothetical protein
MGRRVLPGLPGAQPLSGLGSLAGALYFAAPGTAKSPAEGRVDRQHQFRCNAHRLELALPHARSAAHRRSRSHTTPTALIQRMKRAIGRAG